MRNLLHMSFAGLLVVLLWTSLALGEIPAAMNYQGRLLDKAGQPVEDGVYAVTFRIFNESNDRLWEEYHEVTTEGGLFSVLLGTRGAPVTPGIFTYEQCWLEVEIEGEEPMTPRTPIMTVPFSFMTNNAETAQTLQGQTPSSFAPASHHHSASDLVSGTVSPDRFIAYEDLVTEGYLDGVDSYDLLTKGQADASYVGAVHSHDAGDIVSGTLDPARYSAWQDLWDEGVFTTNPPATSLLTEGQSDAKYSPIGHEHPGSDIMVSLYGGGYLDNNDAGDLLRVTDGNSRYSLLGHTHTDLAQPVQGKFSFEITDWSGASTTTTHAVVAANGNKLSGGPLNSCVWDATNHRYQIHPTYGFELDSASVKITPIADVARFATYGQSGVYLVVYIWEL